MIKAKQLTLFSFSDHHHNVLRCVELDHDLHAHFLPFVPKTNSSDMVMNVKTRGLGDLVIIGRDMMNMEAEPVPAGFVPKPSTVPVMMSALQKCVRRVPFHTKTAVGLAMTLLFTDSTALWRRLPIIMVEDGHITRDLGFLVWCMMASSTKNWSAPRLVVSRMLGIVREMACDMKCNQWHSTHHGQVTTPEMLCQLTVDSIEANVAWACYVRSLFGGMLGDMNMLRLVAAAVKTYNLEEGQTPIESMSERPELITRASDIPWVAADFHCFPQILNMFPEQCGTPDDIKARMWAGSSSINFRHPVPLEVYDLRDMHHAFAIKLIKQVFNN